MLLLSSSRDLVGFSLARPGSKSTRPRCRPSPMVVSLSSHFAPRHALNLETPPTEYRPQNLNPPGLISDPLNLNTASLGRRGSIANLLNCDECPHHPGEAAPPASPGGDGAPPQDQDPPLLAAGQPCPVCACPREKSVREMQRERGRAGGRERGRQIQRGG